MLDTEKEKIKSLLYLFFVVRVTIFCASGDNSNNNNDREQGSCTNYVILSLLVLVQQQLRKNLAKICRQKQY